MKGNQTRPVRVLWSSIDRPFGGFRNLVQGMISHRDDDDWCKFGNVNPLHTWPRKTAKLQDPNCVIVKSINSQSRLAIKVPRGSSISRLCSF